MEVVVVYPLSYKFIAVLNNRTRWIPVSYWYKFSVANSCPVIVYVDVVVDAVADADANTDDANDDGDDDANDVDDNHVDDGCW